MIYAIIIWSWLVHFDPFDTSLDGFWIVSTTFLAQFQVNNFDLATLVVFGLIQTREYAFNWFTMESLHECLLDICHLHGLGQHIPSMFIIDPYVQMIPNWSKNVRDTQMQHILNIYHWNS